MTGTELGYPSLAVRCGKKIRKVNSPPVPASYSHILPFTRCLRSVPYASYPYPSETYERSEEQTSGERDGKRSSLAPVSDGR